MCWTRDSTQAGLRCRALLRSTVSRRIDPADYPCLASFRFEDNTDKLSKWLRPFVHSVDFTGMMKGLKEFFAPVASCLLIVTFDLIFVSSSASD